MANEIYRRVMESARRAAQTGKDINLVAPPAGRLRDAWLREYEREKATLDNGAIATDNAQALQNAPRGTGEQP